MAITAYCGVMGSGKSYEVVTSVILPAIRSGRRVVTNIPLNVAAFASLLKVPEADVSALFVGVTNADFASGSVFPSGDPLTGGVLLGGDLVVIDECRVVFGGGKVLPPVTDKFLRMHRHFTSDAGVSCDVVLISQHPGDFPPAVKGVVELSFRFKKLKVVGQPNRYVVSMFEGIRQTKTEVVNQEIRKYNKDFFPLYQSYTSSGSSSGVESVVDKRQNVLKSRKFLFLFVIIPILAVSGWHFTGRFFFRSPSSKPAPVSSVAPVVKGPARVVRAAPAEVPSSDFRICGFVAARSRFLVFVCSSSSSIFEVPSDGFEFVDGRPVRGRFRGALVVDSFFGGSK